MNFIRMFNEITHIGMITKAMLIDKASKFREYVHMLFDLGCQDYRKPVITD